jgi:hypothetical protein
MKVRKTIWGSQYYQNEAQSKTDPLVYGRKRDTIPKLI